MPARRIDVLESYRQDKNENSLNNLSNYQSGRGMHNAYFKIRLIVCPKASMFTQSACGMALLN